MAWWPDPALPGQALLQRTDGPSEPLFVLERAARTFIFARKIFLTEKNEKIAF
jgi:hypothetical protein